MEPPDFQPPYVPGTPMAPLEYHRQDVSLPFRKRQTALLVWGILICVFGGFLALSGLVSPLAIFTVQDPEMRHRMLILMIGSGLTNVFNGGCTIWLGVGLCMARKWARAVAAALAGWMVYAMAIGLVVFAANAPGLIDTSNLSTPAVAGLIGGAAGVLISLGVTFALFRFLRQSDTRSTVHHFDRQPRWTDRYNGGVLFILLLASLSALQTIPSLFMTIGMKGASRQGDTMLAVLPHAISFVGFSLGAVFAWRRHIAGLYLTAATMTAVAIANLLLIDHMPVLEFQGTPAGPMRNMLPTMFASAAIVSLAALVAAVKLRWYFSDAAPQQDVAPPLDWTPPPPALAASPASH